MPLRNIKETPHCMNQITGGIQNYIPGSNLVEKVKSVAIFITPHQWSVLFFDLVCISFSMNIGYTFFDKDSAKFLCLNVPHARIFFCVVGTVDRLKSNMPQTQTTNNYLNICFM